MVPHGFYTTCNTIPLRPIQYTPQVFYVQGPRKRRTGNDPNDPRVPPLRRLSRFATSPQQRVGWTSSPCSRRSAQLLAPSPLSAMNTHSPKQHPGCHCPTIQHLHNYTLPPTPSLHHTPPRFRTPRCTCWRPSSSAPSRPAVGWPTRLSRSPPRTRADCWRLWRERFRRGEWEGQRQEQEAGGGSRS